ncbi:GntR family transcriptional regulator [Pseudomonas sp.]|uniref:GntR family transcriptional regulator n=1 Tax=Pseudomonas sp. TaxID=306 RepID=UPI0028A7B581|nr:GntR family transcriptional regulator [Pseudomonas sp.]
MTFTAPDSVSEQIAQHLAERIIRGQLKERERIQEVKVVNALNVSRGSVREALLILERRHMVDILPRRGAQVSELTPHHVHSLYALVTELYILLSDAVADRWRRPDELQPFVEVQKRLVDGFRLGDVEVFVQASIDAVRATFPFANNPYLQCVVEDLQPAVARTHHLALDGQPGEMQEMMNAFAHLLQAVIDRNPPRIREVVSDYCQHNCRMVLAALARR